MDWRTHISSDPNICHGKMCFRGTRVLVSVILDCLENEMSQEEILRDYPSLTVDSLEAALVHHPEINRHTFPGSFS